MKVSKILIVVCLLFLFVRASAQVNYQQQYLNAKELFADGKYSLAMEAFKPLMQQNESNPFPAYASFYYAVAAYKDGYAPMAKNMFLQIGQRFPKWSKQDEINFWLGKIYFENREYNQGLNVLGEIKDRAFQEDITNLKYYTFFEEDNLEMLKELYANHPEDNILGEVIAKKIVREPLVNQDQELLDQLISKFNLDEKGLDMVKVEQTVFKDKYRVAVLFPFLIRNLEVDDRKRVNQLVLDVYQGIRLAADSLRGNGINIDIYAYDTRGEEKATAKILADEEMKSMDLIIGPLFPGPRQLVQDFSFQNKINMINPLSSDSDVIGVNPYSFLLHPSNETVGRKTAEFVAKRMKNKNGIIFYGENRGDSTLAFAYKQRIEEEGFNIVIAKEIKRNSTREILDLLLISDKAIKEASTEEGKQAYTLAPDSIGHIFVASDNDLISSKVVSAVETRGDSIKVVGSAEWLDLPVINYEVYQQLGVELYAPLYMQKETEAYEKFREEYVAQHKVPPSKYAEIGYALMNFTGHSLQQYGKYFQLGWNKTYLIKGDLTMGYCYHHSQDNEVVPILEFTSEGLKISYEIEKDQNEDREK